MIVEKAKVVIIPLADSVAASFASYNGLSIVGSAHPSHLRLAIRSPSRHFCFVLGNMDRLHAYDTSLSLGARAFLGVYVQDMVHVPHLYGRHASCPATVA